MNHRTFTIALAAFISQLPNLAVPALGEEPSAASVPQSEVSPATVLLSPDLAGHVVVRDASGGIVAELEKVAGTPLGLTVAPGTYEVSIASPEGARRGTLTLEGGASKTVEADALVAAPPEPRAAEPSPPTVVEPGYRSVPFNVQIVPGFGVSGFDGSDVEQGFSLDLIAGRVAALDGLELSTVLAWETERARGVQLSGAVGLVEGPLSGLQLAGGASVVTGDVSGVQGATALDLAGGHISGIQAASGVNIAGSLTGAQLAAGVNVSRGPSTGFQGAGVNVAVGELVGMQAAGGVNVVAGDMTGLQVAPLNVTTGRVRGVQLGVVNYAEDVDAPIGILSIVKNGQHHVDVWGSDAVPVAVAAHIGGKYVYNLFAAGTNPVGDRTKWLLGLGIGGHIPLTEDDAWFMDLDLLTWHINEGSHWTNDLHLLNQARVMGGYRFAPRFAVFGGVSANVLTSRVSDGADWRLGAIDSWEHNGTRMVAWPGFLLGVRI